MLKEAGYRTAHYGKWHLSGGGITDAPHPSAYGYDDAAVFSGPAKQVFTGTRFEPMGITRRSDAHAYACYLSVAATDHALRFIRESSDSPFFVNLWLHETHHLVAATEEEKSVYPDIPEPQKTYLASVTRMDREVGRVLALLNELGLSENTIVAFSSDNGPEVPDEQPGEKFYFSVGSTGGLRGRKRSLFMGGVNTPFIVAWPGQIPAGRVDKTTPVSAVDVLPTLLAAAGVAPPKDYEADGDNILPLLRGEKFNHSKPLFWEWQGNHSAEENWPEFGMREGRWGLLWNSSEKRVELFDLIADRAQQNNLAKRYPDRTANMVAAIRTWVSTLPPASKRSPNIKVP